MKRTPDITHHTGSVSVENKAGFAEKVQGLANVNFNRCYHCMSCTNGCPFLQAMDFSPNAVIRMIQFQMEQKVLSCSTIWTCVGCNTCSSQCPMLVDMGRVMDTLRQMAIEKGITPAQPDVLNFHNEVLSSIKKYGRTHKLEIMMRYKVKKRDWFGDMDVGLKMLAKRKLDLTPSRVKDIKKIRSIFQQSQKGPHHG